MSRLKKILDFFSDEVEDENSEKQILKKELEEESKKYNDKSDKEPEQEEVKPIEKEQIKKQVLFMDEDFQRTTEKKQESVEKPVKYVSDEPKFKPSSFISPVHGLLKNAEEVPEYETEKKTKSESDYAKIRERAFEKGSEDNDEVEERDIEEEVQALEDNASFKIFKTSEIVNLQKRIQIDDSASYDENTSLEDAYKYAKDNQYIDTKNFQDQDKQHNLFDLLDDFKEEDESDE